MMKTDQDPARTDAIGIAPAIRKPRRPQRMARAAAVPVETLAAEPAPETQPAPRATSKTAGVVALLQRDQGATLAELVAATGWQPHTTRAALTGLRKKGHVIEKTKRGDATCYRIVEAA